MYQVELTQSLFPAQYDEDYHQQTIGEMLQQITAANPNATALTEIDENGKVCRQWNYQQLLDDSQRLAQALSSRFMKGEAITLWAPNCPEWLLIEFACAFAGIVLVTANPSYQAKELRYILEQSDSIALLLVNEHRGNPMSKIAKDACNGLNNIRAIIDIEDQTQLYEPLKDISLQTVLPTDIAQIQYTSGTTGFPKGVVLEHAPLLNNARFYAKRAAVDYGDVWLNMMPMFHTSGCAMTVLGGIQQGCHLVSIRIFQPDIACRLIEQHQVNMIFGVPTMFIAMLDYLQQHSHDLSSVKSTSSGGAMVAPELVHRIKNTFQCHFGTVFGQTEAYPVVTQHHTTDSDDDISYSIGQPLPHTSVSIRSLNDNSVLPLNSVGEICVGGPFIMRGYHRNPAATKETIDNEGWLHTGDLGKMDSRGYLQITGRAKEMIIRGGENMYPVEIENVIIEHEDVTEVAVVGIPDDKWGEVIACFVRTKNNITMDVEQLRQYCRNEMSAQKTPSIWRQVDSFPLTGSNKIQRLKLRENFINGR